MKQKELSCDAITTESSANPPGGSEAGVALQKWLELGEGAGPSYPCVDQSLSPGRGALFG